MVDPVENDAGIATIDDWDAGFVELNDGGFISLTEPEPFQGLLHNAFPISVSTWIAMTVTPAPRTPVTP